MNKFKNFAEAKRALVIGSRWDCKFYGFGQIKKLGVRKVSIVQSNAVAFKTDKGDSWLYFPKAKDVRLTRKGFDIYEDNQKLLSYELIEK